MALGYEVEVLTFSQAGEDLVVRNYFYERLNLGEKGFFVDIGAFHPYRHSNTYYLYRAGWRGINIDARPGSMYLFNKLRQEDNNLEIAVGANEGTATYYDFGENAGLNTLSTDYIDKLGTRNDIKGEYSVQTIPLLTVFERYVPKDRKIDFLSIDIEGLEEPVLSTNDWSKYRPSLIACEIYGQSLSDISKDPVANILLSNGYEIYTRINLAMPKVNTVFFNEIR
jgi:FkbM family methyltransferase